MNKAKIIAHLTDPSSLFNTSYEELKTLALQYPYSANLKYLMLSKSRLDKHAELARNLHLAAIYSIDRPYLRRLMMQKVTPKSSDDLLKQEEVLVLKDPKRLELDIQKLKGESIKPTAPEINAEVPKAASSFIPMSPSIEKNQDVILKEPSEPEPIIATDILDKVAKLNEEIEALDFSKKEDLDQLSRLSQEIKDLLEGEVKEGFESEITIHKPKIKPTAQKASIKKVSAKKKKKKEQKSSIPDKKEQEVEKIATKSVEKKESMASETLAMILVKQGLIEEAIEMYEQLILTFPKKKAFFAAKINSLKK